MHLASNALVARSTIVELFVLTILDAKVTQLIWFVLGLLSLATKPLIDKFGASSTIRVY